MIIYVRPELGDAFVSLLRESYRVGMNFVSTSHTHFNIMPFKDELKELDVLVDSTVGPSDYWLTEADVQHLTLIPREARWAYLLELGKPHD